jgi:hypothetical protein
MTLPVVPTVELWMIELLLNNESELMWKEAVMRNLRDYPDIYLEEQEKYEKP